MTRRFPRIVLGAALALAAAAGVPAPSGAAGERIVHFDSEVWVHGDASLTVREEITVESAGRQIKRGIYRDFPTIYEDRFGRRAVTGFEVLRVLRDGRPEPYHRERLSNGVRVYIGREDVFIPRGRHEYTLEYRTDRQIGFFEDFDELYWNVTGNGWAFEIGRARARVHLPDGARVLETAGYTGRTGERGRDYSQGIGADGAVAFETTRALAPGEGLTVAVSWPPGFVARPTETQRLAYFLQDNRVLVAGLLGFGGLGLYYLLVWVRVGRDPEAGPIVPLYEPPRGFTPAAARYVTRMGYDDKAFTAAIVNLAVKGYLTIEEDARGHYTLRRTGRGENLSAGERAVAGKLFAGGRREVELEQKNHTRLRAAQKALRIALKNDFEKTYFVRNTRYFLPGIALSVVALGLVVAAADQPVAAGFMCVWLSGWSVAVYYLFRRMLTAWRAARAGDWMMGGQAIGATLFALPFFGGEVMGLWFFAGVAGAQGTLVLIGLLLVNFIFYHLLKAPTLLGRRVMDRLEGFADYLGVAETDRMNLLNPPERTPELFERFLPYALALGVEQAWSEQFADVIDRAGQDPARAGGAYQPGWYSGHAPRGGLGDLASSLGGGFAGAVASASTAPGSSGGSGGGGSSGGGGGGGGGGGW